MESRPRIKRRKRIAMPVELRLLPGRPDERRMTRRDFLTAAGGVGAGSERAWRRVAGGPRLAPEANGRSFRGR